MQNHLLEKLLEVQRELSHAKAEAVNGHFGNQYVPYEALWDYAKEALNKHDILIQQVSHECEVGVCIETMLFGHGASLSTGKMIVRATSLRLRHLVVLLLMPSDTVYQWH